MESFNTVAMKAETACMCSEFGMSVVFLYVHTCYVLTKPPISSCRCKDFVILHPKKILLQKRTGPYICMYVYTYIKMHTCMHAYIHTHTYTYLETCASGGYPRYSWFVYIRMYVSTIEYVTSITQKLVWFPKYFLPLFCYALRDMAVTRAGCRSWKGTLLVRK